MISVIVPIYNSEKYLNQCLTSLVKQTYSDLEIILVNDGSTDSSMNICEKFKKEDDRIILINKKNQGLVRARKDGARKATGEYITFIDADDWIDADTYDNLRDFKSDIIAYGLVEEYGYKIKKKTNKFKDGFYEKDKISDYIIPQMLCVDNFFEFGLLPNLVCKLIKRTLFLEMMGEVSNDVSVGEDVDFFYRLVFKAETLTIRSYCPYHYRQHSESMMRKKIDIESIKKLYFDLLTINGVKKKTEWEIQLNKYIMFVMLLKIPDKVVHLIREISEINGSVVIYGAGAFGKGIYTQLKQNKKIKELFIVDKQWKDLSKEKILIDNPERIADINPDKVIITILDERVCDYVKEYLIGIGIGTDKIFSLNYVLPLKKINFENKVFLGPGNPDKMLEMEYGDYMQWPNDAGSTAHGANRRFSRYKNYSNPRYIHTKSEAEDFCKEINEKAGDYQLIVEKYKIFNWKEYFDIVDYLDEHDISYIVYA